MSICEIEKYFAIAVDPIHVGTGGYRIGRVDNTIVREPSTNLPKIPGTTLEGAARNYAYLIGKENKVNNLRQGCAKGKNIDNETDEKNQPCGNCELCVTFGYSKKNDSLHGLAQFSDAQILFYPVATMVGPVWVTSKMVLKDAGIITNESGTAISTDKFITAIQKLPIRDGNEILNLGWILLEKAKEMTFPNKWQYNGKELSSLHSFIDILSRTAIVHDNIFSQIVNMNLEVRTSVAIDPLRGAAEEGALFTYEAIPRGTIFWFDMVYQDPANFPSISGFTSQKIKDTVNEGLTLMQYLGLGGMSTRGFGKIKFLNQDSKEEKKGK